MIEQLAEIAEKIESSILKADVIYLLGQTGDNKVSKSIAKFSGKIDDKLICDESKHALETFRFSGIYTN